MTPPLPGPSAKLLWDARRAAERVARFTAGRSFDGYLVDEMLRSAVERQLGILGEAFAALRRTDPALAAASPTCRGSWPSGTSSSTATPPV